MVSRKLSFFLFLAAAAAAAAAAQSSSERGLRLHEATAFDGLNLFSPLQSGTTYLMDNDGRLIHKWESDYRPGQPYLLPNGHLLRNGGFGLAGNGTFHGGGAGYRIEEFTWDGERVWNFVYASDQHLMHHDIEPLPNGNVLILAWEMKTREEAVAAGRNPGTLRDGELWSEHILEVKPVYPDGGEIVWEWHLWDHLVQDFDPAKGNFGEVAAHPELVDIDPPGFWMDRISGDEMEALESLGYLGSDDKKKQSQPNPQGGSADWHHMNAIAYNAKHDLIALSSLGYNELWIIDHSATTAEAKGHSGGTYGKGGDLLYRWGNPLAYRLGAEADQQLFAQHDVRWIAEDCPGAGDITIFNNGRGRSGGAYSSVVQITPPFDPETGFFREERKAWGPAQPTWEYTAPNKPDFNSFFISGATRLPNGNTLICSGAQGAFFEVTPEKMEVWRYLNAANPPQKKRPPGPGAGRPGPPNINPSFLQNTVYRIYRYPRDYSAFEGKDLTPGPILIDYLKENPGTTPKDLEEESIP